MAKIPGPHRDPMVVVDVISGHQDIESRVPCLGLQKIQKTGWPENSREWGSLNLYNWYIGDENEPETSLLRATQKKTRFKVWLEKVSWMSQFFKKFHGVSPFWIGNLDRSTDGFRALAWSPDCSRLVARYLRVWQRSQILGVLTGFQKFWWPSKTHKNGRFFF